MRLGTKSVQNAKASTTFDSVLTHLSENLAQLARVYQEDVRAVRLENEILRSGVAEQDVNADVKLVVLDNVECDFPSQAILTRDAGTKAMYVPHPSPTRSDYSSLPFSGQISAPRAKRIGEGPARRCRAGEDAAEATRGLGVMPALTQTGGPRPFLTEPPMQPTSLRMKKLTIQDRVEEFSGSESSESNALTVGGASNHVREMNTNYVHTSQLASTYVMDYSAHKTDSEESYPERSSDTTTKTAYIIKSPFAENMNLGGHHTLKEIYARHNHKSSSKNDLAKLANHYDMIMRKQSEDSLAIERNGDRCCVINPESSFRGCWALISICFLVYDLVMVPFNICFAKLSSDAVAWIDVSSTCFWMADMFVSFFTGFRPPHTTRVEMNQTRVAWHYLRTWFLFDFCLVCSEVLTMALEDYFSSDSPVTQASFLRVVRVGHLSRLVRMARIARLTRMRPLLRYAALRLNLTTMYVNLSQGCFGVTAALILFVHYISCLWYAVGTSDRGWVETNDLESASVGHAYAVSCHWTLSRLHGMMSNLRIASDFEKLADALLIFCSLLMAAFYSGEVAAAVAVGRSTRRDRDLWRLSILFVRRHDISPSLNMKLLKCLETKGAAGVTKIASGEAALLNALPTSLQHDLMFESRVFVLLNKLYFRDMFWETPRIVRLLCIDAMSQLNFFEDEVVFVHGDACTSMFFIAAGSLVYTYDTNPGEVDMNITNAAAGGLRPVADVVRNFVSDGKRETEFKQRELGRHSVLSEPVLWTQWTRMYRLTTCEESSIVELDSKRFAEVIVDHRAPLIHAVRYARRFVSSLNELEQFDDLICFNINIEELDDRMLDGADSSHFMFISHYKVEAGTEASLMRDLLLDLLKQHPAHVANDLRSPIFIDSEDLVDLSTLKEHVETSATFVLLLTPGVLLRPWCLVEIVTAVRHCKTILPVEIQRPGSCYDYPDEEFYSQLRKGSILGATTMGILQGNDITLSDVENCIRQVFQKIALPFSPHKSKTVREAELRDIFGRCKAEQRPEMMRHTPRTSKRARAKLSLNYESSESRGSKSTSC